MALDGFVLAMRGQLTLMAGRARRRRLNDVWLVVSRFGPAGLILAVGLVGAGGGEAARPQLVPRMTVLGRQVPPRPGRAGLFFRLLEEPLPQMRFAGRWCATSGHARLCGDRPGLCLLASGRLATGTTWRIHARQRPWIGDWPAPEPERRGDDGRGRE